MKLHRRIGWRKLFTGAALALLAGLIAADRVVAYKVAGILQPPRTSGPEFPDDGHPIRQVSLRTSDGLALAARHLPSRNGATVILQHGYGANASQMLPIGQMLAGRGYGVFWFDFRAHGRSEGDEVTFGLREVLDTQAAADYPADLPDSGSIAVLGNSMGGATAILAAAEDPRIKAVVAEGAFADLIDEVGIGIRVQAHLPAWPFARLFVACAERQAGYRIGAISPARAIGRIAPRAVLILQGEADDRIPLDSGRRLFDAAGEPPEIWSVPGAGRVAISRADPEEYGHEVAGFLDRHLPRGQ